MFHIGDTSNQRAILFDFTRSENGRLKQSGVSLVIFRSRARSIGARALKSREINGYATATGCRRPKRNIAPNPPNPIIIITQVAGSGAAEGPALNEIVSYPVPAGSVLL